MGDYQPGDLVKVASLPGIAYRVIGPDTAPDEDAAWSGIEPETGMLRVVAVGDDRIEIVDPGDVTAIDREEFCGQCGQIGCAHDGR